MQRGAPHTRESETQKEDGVPMAFRAEDEVRPLGAAGGSPSQNDGRADCSVIGCLPCPRESDKEVFLAIALMGKAPDLNSFKGGVCRVPIAFSSESFVHQGGPSWGGLSRTPLIVKEAFAKWP